jgi:D-sedoheptulose 7-phosphate isomerase
MEGRKYLEKLTVELDRVDLLTVFRFSEIVFCASQERRSIFTFGNGGSAATGIHLSNDIMRASYNSLINTRSMSLNANPSSISAIANDHGYDEVFTRQLQVLASPGDVLIALSASGNSPNCIKALEYGKSIGAINLCLLGFDGGAMKGLCRESVHVPSNDYGIVEDIHLTIVHLVTKLLVGMCKAAETPILDARS